jgi:hypothetical protein
LARALDGLPVRIEQAAGAAAESQKAAAQKAIALFAQVRPTLESLKYDEAEVKAKMDELGQIIDQVSKP